MTELSDSSNTSTQRVLSTTRALASLLVGTAVAGGITAVLQSWAPFPLVLWNVSAAALLIRVWTIAWPQDSAGTKRIAEREGRRSVTDAAVLIATFASVGAVIAGLIRASGSTDPVNVLIVVLTVSATVLSWAMVNTVFALKYARLYYLDVDGGLDFHQDEPPSYADFAYLAFTVGVAFAVSEAQPTSTAVRKLVLPHELLCYAYTTFVIAVAVNLVTNL